MATEHVVGTVSELPVGSKRIIKIGSLEIGVFNVNGTYYALPNHCFHQGGPLCEGKTTGTVHVRAENDWKPEWVQEGEILVCPWHGLEFEISTGRCLARKRARLRRYRVVVDGEEVKVVI